MLITNKSMIVNDINDYRNLNEDHASQYTQDI